MSKPIYLFSISSHPKATSINSLEIRLLKPDIDFSKYDYLIITSKQSSEALKQYEPKNYVNIPALCVSAQSALSFESIGGKVLDIGAGYGDDLVGKIKEFEKSSKWLYLRAKIVASSFVEACKNEGYDIDECIVYESFCSKDILNVEVEDDSVLIFTSPSSLKCFLQTHTISSKNRVVVIGKSTAKALPEAIDYHLSKTNTIESCIEAALKL